MNQRFLRVLLSGVILLLMASTYAFADNVYATIRGTVTDQTGAVVQGAQITATNSSTGIEYTTKSLDSGTYEFLQLPIGTYTISATKQGFKVFKSTGITLTVNQVYTQAIALQVGTANETVEVRANAVQVETTDIQQKSVIAGNQIVDLPLNGRNFTQLEQLSPGVMAASDRMGNFSVNGSQTQQSSYLINGTDSNDIALNQPGLLPSPDAIQEFSLISSTINPEYGRNSGGIVNAVIKNGTNQWHGGIFDFYRDTFLNARNYFTVGDHQPIFHQNQFGGTFGGPIHKDKTFFFLSYQGTYNAVATPTVTTVFSDAQRGGNFAENLSAVANSADNVIPFNIVGDDHVNHVGAASGGTAQWFGTTTINGVANNPLVTGIPLVGVFNCGNATGSPGHITACSNPNFGILGTGNFNSLATGLMNQFVPHSNAPSNGFAFSPFNTGKTDQGIARIDHTFNASNSIWGVFAENNNRGTQGLPFIGATLPGFNTFSTANTKEITLAYTHTFSTTALNEVRLGYWRLNLDTVEPAKTVPISSFGFTNIITQNPKASQLPVIAVTGLFNLGFSDDGPQPRKDQNYQFTDNFTKVVGKHTFKFGFDARRFQVDNPFFFLIDGHFDFGGAGGFSSGNPATDFLLGIPDDYAQDSGAVINARAYEYYSYAQDQWKVRSNLTLTYGAGYQVDTPFGNNQYGGKAFNCLIPGQQSKVFPAGPGPTGAPAGMNFPGDPGCTNSGTTTKYGHLGPRFGFAYSPQWGGRVTRGQENKTSIRGGFGIYFNRYEEETALQNLGAPPFGLESFGASDFGGSPTFANPWADISGVPPPPGFPANKFPFTPPALGSAVDFTFFEPMSLNTNSSTLSTPSSMNFNLNIQREFASNTVVSVGYVGALGRHLYRAYESDPITLAGAAACATSTFCVGHRNLQHFLFPSHSVLGANLAQCPPTGACFGSWGTQFTDGTSNYNALQVNVTKGLTHGLQIITSYTWSHSIDNGSGFENSGFGTRGTNPFFPNLNVGDSGQDARQRLVAGYIYAIPSLHSRMNWANDRIFGGWKFSGITTFQTGFPVNFSDSGFRSLTCDTFSFYGCPDNPNQVVSSIVTLDPHTSNSASTFGTKTNYFFNPADFTRQTIGTFGNTGRNSLHGPHINNTDFALLKDTKISEGKNLQVGIEAFNIFNHTQFCTATSCVQGNRASSNFGRITTAAPARIVQLRAKFNF